MAANKGNIQYSNLKSLHNIYGKKNNLLEAQSKPAIVVVLLLRLPYKIELKVLWETVLKMALYI